MYSKAVKIEDYTRDIRITYGNVSRNTMMINQNIQEVVANTHSFIMKHVLMSVMPKLENYILNQGKASGTSNHA